MTTKPLESKSQPFSLSGWARQWSGKFLSPLVGALARLGFTPNAITLIGLALSAAVGGLLATGRLSWGGGLILAAGIFDALDGALARSTAQQTRFGAFLDSALDRYSDAFVFMGLAWFYLGVGARVEVMLAIASLLGSLMVSYTRARAEGLGLECKVGVLTRFERVLIVAAGLIVGLVQPMLWVMAVLTNLTALQRILHVWQMTKKGEG